MIPLHVSAAFESVSPRSGSELIFQIIAMLATLIAFGTIHRVYRVVIPNRPRLTRVLPYLVALGISWVPVMALAAIFEGHDMLLPGHHSAVFFIGDGLLLPLMAYALGRMRAIARVDNPLADSLKWRLAMMAVAVVVSFFFHFSQFMSWPYGALHAPSKTWHDFFVYPVFIYYLGSQLPFLFQGAWKRRLILQVALVSTVVLGFVSWYTLANYYDPHHRTNVFIVASAHPPLR